MSSKYFLMWLEGPLQAWGASSKFGLRGTLDFPTKSGVLGLICCGMGKSGEQREFLARFAGSDMTVFSFNQRESYGEKNVRPREPVMTDFQMVGSGYNSSDPWESLMSPKKADGTNPVGAGSKMTYRSYLQGAAFSVILEVPDDLADCISNGLVEPVWELFLGRKTCIPTEFIYQGCFDTRELAGNAAKSIAEKKSMALDFSVMEGRHKGNVLVINDVPVSFGKHKEYRSRNVTVV